MPLAILGTTHYYSEKKINIYSVSSFYTLYSRNELLHHIRIKIKIIEIKQIHAKHLELSFFFQCCQICGLQQEIGDVRGARAEGYK